MARFIVAIVALLCAATASSGGFSEFVFAGRVTESTHADIPVGDPFTLTFVADDIDSDPDPKRGLYRSTQLLATFPNFSYLNNGYGAFHVNLGASGLDYARYVAINPNVDLMIAGASYPAGTLLSDELPDSLPISNSISFNFTWSSIWPPFNLTGQITSSTITEVPESSVTMFAVLVTILARARKRCSEVSATSSSNSTHHRTLVLRAVES